MSTWWDPRITERKRPVYIAFTMLQPLLGGVQLYVALSRDVGRAGPLFVGLGVCLLGLGVFSMLALLVLRRRRRVPASARSSGCRSDG